VSEAYTFDELFTVHRCLSECFRGVVNREAWKPGDLPTIEDVHLLATLVARTALALSTAAETLRGRSRPDATGHDYLFTRTGTYAGPGDPSWSDEDITRATQTEEVDQCGPELIDLS
jgi:hypothetical protein